MVDPIRVLLADDHADVRRCIRQALEPEFEVVDDVSDGCQLVDRVLELDPDVIVVDISMSGLSGIDAVRECHQRGAHPHIVFLTVHDEPEFVDRALATGARGYVLKARAAADLPDAISAVVAGGRFLSPSLCRA